MTKEIRDPADLKAIKITTSGQVCVGSDGVLRYSILIERIAEHEWKNAVKWLNAPKIHPPRTKSKTQIWSSHESALFASLSQIRSWVSWITAAKTGIEFEIKIETQTADRRNATAAQKDKKK